MVSRDIPWPPGTPCWVDLAVDDLDRAFDFYSTLLGWEIQRGGPEVGGYSLAQVGGRPVAGIGPKMGGTETPTAWTTYFASEDADRTAADITAAGGTVLMGPMDVMDLGRMIVAADPGGGVFGVWQAGVHTGMQAANEPGAVSWNENLSRAYEANRDFYAAVFGYKYGDIEGAGIRYATLDLDERPVGGIGELPAEAPAEIPAHWMTYFSVPDTDAAVAQVGELGGTVAQEPWDTPYGRMAAVLDNQGAAFSLISEPPRQ